MLNAEYTKAFQRDIKRLKCKHADFTELKNVIRLVLEDTDEAKETLRRRHRAHRLQGREFGYGRMAPLGFSVRAPTRSYSATDGASAAEIIPTLIVCSEAANGRRSPRGYG